MATISPRRLLRSLQTALDVYSIRFSIGLIASLLLVIGITRLPLREASLRVGWNATAAGESIQLSDFRLEMQDDARRSTSDADASASLVTRQDPTPEALPDEARLTAESSPATSEPGAGTDTASTRQEVLQLAALGPSDHRPRFVGGHGSFYLRIDYPDEAREQGIQGRMVLDFVVDTDGVPRGIRVAQSLHPLCDSSAVAALKQSRFVPARRNGKKISVRMRLPVRFQIVNYTVNTADAKQQTAPPNPF